jgi:ATP-dependent RNA helicase DeaD
MLAHRISAAFSARALRCFAASNAPLKESAASREVDKPKFFADLPLNSSLLRAVRDMGLVTMTPVQAATLPPLLAGKDMLAKVRVAL